MADRSSDLVQSLPSMGGEMYDGLIKLKLVHAEGLSVLLPDFLFIELNGWKWFQPCFFTAVLISFLDDQALGQLSIDIADGPRLLVGLTDSGLVRRFDDGSQLYRCRISGPPNLEAHSSGTCAVTPENEIALDLYHHTLPETVELIRSSGHFRGSIWNIQGNRELANVSYAYFTNLPSIGTDDDLRAIAMASDGKIMLRTTNATTREDLVEIQVYRQSTWDRRATLRVAIPVELIASQHVYRHAPHGDIVHYEVSHPAISRVGLLPNRVIRFDRNQLLPTGYELKRFEYVVLGDADTKEGLIAPYDEEHTRSVFLIEHCQRETFFDYWRRCANTDQVSGRFVEKIEFK